MSESLKPEELSVILSGNREFRLNLSEEISTVSVNLSKYIEAISKGHSCTFWKAV